MTNLEDCKSRLTMRLTPFLALRVPHLDRYQTGPGHGQIRCVENISSLTVHIYCTIPVPEDLEDREIASTKG